MSAQIVIEFKNLVETCGSIGNGSVVAFNAKSATRSFVASNAAGEAVLRTQSQIKHHAKSIASLMCK